MFWEEWRCDTKVERKTWWDEEDEEDTGPTKAALPAGRLLSYSSSLFALLAMADDLNFGF
jgi:hypothetical protein